MTGLMFCSDGDYMLSKYNLYAHLDKLVLDDCVAFVTQIDLGSVPLRVEAHTSG